jgi:asparagine synthase (glutamine-hydrolysing)
MPFRSIPGVLAVASHDGAEPSCGGAVERVGLPPLRRVGTVWLTSWGHDPDLPTFDRPLLLSGPARHDGTTVPDARVTRLIREDDFVELGRFLPPFGAVGLAEDGLRIVVDRMGFRQLFWARGPDWDAASTSARLLGLLVGRGLDEEAVLVQSQVGWQLGQRTLYRGVAKLAPGESVLLCGTRLRVDHHAASQVQPGSTSLDEAVDHASATLRRTMSEYVDHADDPLLQLTGGMDSRLVLSSVPKGRRSALRAMTLDVPGSSDAAVARTLADRCGVHHRVVSLDGLGSVPPSEWFERVRVTAESHDAMLDPVAKAATDWAEEEVDQGNRVGGLGGEIARGFYYTGRVRPVSVTRRRSERLARWRVLANEAVEIEALNARHRHAATVVALDAVHSALVEAGDEWFSATDELYYRHRMTRWAGLAESAVSTRRLLMNPLLHPDFIDMARSLSPRDKAHARFLGRLQMALDPELGRMPLDSRPPPEAFAYPGLGSRPRQAYTRSRSALRKAAQRARGARRAPAGGGVVAAGVLQHLRTHIGLADPLRGSGWFDPDWLEGVLDGTVLPQPNTVAFMMNVLVGLDSGGQPHGTPST